MFCLKNRKVFFFGGGGGNIILSAFGEVLFFKRIRIRKMKQYSNILQLSDFVDLTFILIWVVFFNSRTVSKMERLTRQVFLYMQYIIFFLKMEMNMLFYFISLHQHIIKVNNQYLHLIVSMTIYLTFKLLIFFLCERKCKDRHGISVH